MALLIGMTTLNWSSVGAGASPVPPGVATAATATMTGPTTVHVSWVPPVSDGGSEITRYDVYRWPGRWAGAVSRPGPGQPVASSVDVDLDPADTAAFVVLATNAAGASGPSAPSAPVTAPGSPAPPTNVVASMTSGYHQASVSWTPPTVDPLTPLLSFEVALLHGPTLATVPAGPNQATVPLEGAFAGQQARSVQFTVTAHTSAGTSLPSAPSNTITTGTTPPPPSNVTAVATEYLPDLVCVTVSWTAPVEDPNAPITRYRVREVGDGWSFETVDAPGTTTGCQSQYGDRPYQYVVESENFYGVGAPSTPSNAVTVPQHEAAAVPAAPTDVTGMLTDRGEMTVDWTPVPPIPGTADADVVYMVLVTPGNHTSHVGGRGSSSTTVVVDDPSTAYVATVSVKNPGNHGPASEPSAPVTTLGPPAPLTSVVAAAGALGEVTVRWAASPDQAFLPVSGYYVYGERTGPSDCGTGPCRQRAQPVAYVGTPGVTTATIPVDVNTGVDANTSYRFFVRAENAWGASDASTPSNTVRTTTVPVAPTGLHASQKTLDTVHLSWTPPTDDPNAPVTGYEIIGWPTGVQTGLLTPGSGADVHGVAPGIHTFYARAVNGIGEGTWSTVSNAVTVFPGPLGSSFHSMPPVRILDSRTALGGWNATLGAGAPKHLVVSGSGGGAGVPSTATAVVMNVTVTRGTAGSFVTVYPAGKGTPNASNLNFGAGQTIANLVTVKTGAGGQVSFANAVGSVHVIADVVGYYDDGTGAGDLYTAITPTRLLDSRGPNGGWNAELVAGAPRDLPVRRPDNPAGVPGTATAVIANVTVTGSSHGSFVSVWPSGLAQPNVSNLNFGPGQTIPNLAIIRIGDNGAIRLANAVGSVDVIVDVVGYFDPTRGSRFHAIDPTRILDDRIGTGLAGPWGPGQTRALPVAGAAATNVPAGAKGLVANVTVTGGTAGSFITVFPDGVGRPNSSNVNFAAGETIPNLVATGIGTNGRINFSNELGTVDIIADAVGYYALP